MDRRFNKLALAGSFLLDMFNGVFQSLEPLLETVEVLIETVATVATVAIETVEVAMGRGIHVVHEDENAAN